MNPFRWSYRGQCLLGAVLCFSLVGYALYVQYGMFMMPCPLCILQRVAFVAMGVTFLIGALAGSRPFGRRLSAALTFLAAAAGAGVAAWHVRMQNLPPSEVPACSGMDLSYMLDAFPLSKVVEKVFSGSGECAVVDWTFLGLSMPTWTLFWFVGLGIAVLWSGFFRNPRQDS